MTEQVNDITPEEDERLRDLEKKFGIRSTPASRAADAATSPSAQMDIQSEADREILERFAEEMDRDYGYAKLLDNPNYHKLVLVEFDGDEPFLNTWGKNMIAIISPVTWRELVKFGPGEVPATILTNGQTGAIELVEKGIGVLGMPICIPAASDYSVDLIRKGKTDPPLTLMSSAELAAIDNALDKLYLAPPLLNKALNVNASLRIEKQKQFDQKSYAMDTLEGLLEDADIGKGLPRLHVKYRPLIYAAIGIMAFIFVFLYLTRIGVIP